ncbi:hypothetical protein [Brevundimonas diminuta]|uniref:hypothetical protein n=1 Tax=Brevundimonas diminuta TaxID=293 RepID=UPI0030F4C985
MLMEEEVSRLIQPSPLKDKEVKIRYVPIIMPEEMADWYPARSTARAKENIYACCPQLDYNIFVSGDFPSIAREYVRGIFSCVDKLSKVGFTREESDEFRRILLEALDAVLEGHRSSG